MRVTIRRGVEGSRLRDVLPAGVRDRIPPGINRDTRYCVLLFQHTREDVVRSPEVAKALRRVDSGEAIVSVGGAFTSEARAVLSDHGAIIVCLGDFYWTDESYVAIRKK